MLKFILGDMRDFCGRSCFKRKLLSLSLWTQSLIYIGRILHAIWLQKSLCLWRSHKLWSQELSLSHRSSPWAAPEAQLSSPFIHGVSAQFFPVLIISALSREHWCPLRPFSCNLMCIHNRMCIHTSLQCWDYPRGGSWLLDRNQHGGTVCKEGFELSWMELPCFSRDCFVLLLWVGAVPRTEFGSLFGLLPGLAEPVF